MIQAAKVTAYLLALAALPLFAGKPHLGLQTLSSTLRPSSTLAISNTATALSVCLYDSSTRPCCSGKERDGETGLDYFGARYMSAAQGRFTSPDLPFAAQRPEIPQTWNLYTYGRNNPLYFTDPTGRQELGPMCSDGNQQCLDRVGQGTAEVLTGLAKGVVNGVASFLDFVTCPICQPHGDVLPAEGIEQQVGNAAGQILGVAGATKAVGMIAEAATNTGPILNIGSGSNPMRGAINVDLKAGPGVNVIANAEQLPFKSGTFSQAHSINPFGFNPASSETARVLQSGGNLFVSGTPRNPFMTGSQQVSGAFERIGSGPMIGAHQFGTQALSSGRPIPSTLRSITEIFRKR